MASGVDKYGLFWDSSYDSLSIEMKAIQMGGLEEGLPFHYEQMRRILWPQLDDHRWHRLCRDTILKEKVTVLAGCASSAKTHSAAWLYLCEYLCFPEETCVLVSSTTIPALRMRVWGEITKLWQEAKDQYPELPGHLLDGRIAITTDALEDGNWEESRVRDMRRGIVGVPCVAGGKFVGLSKYCFPSGTMVDTPNGAVAIERLKVGDAVISAIGQSRVRAVAHRTATTLLRIYLSNGKNIDCTPEHPFLTSSGWINAVDILPKTELISPDETLQILREGTEAATGAGAVLQQAMSGKNMGKSVSLVRESVHSFRIQSDILFSVLCRELEMEPTSLSSTFLAEPGSSKSGEKHQRGDNGRSERTAAEKSVNLGIKTSPKRFPSIQRDRNWTQDDPWRDYSNCAFPGGAIQPLYSDWAEFQTGQTGRLLLGSGLADNETRCGDRWAIPSERIAAFQRPKKRRVFERVRVDRVEVLRTSGDQRFDQRNGGYKVYNVEVTGHPSYSVENCLVHNCGIKQKRMRLIADEASAMEPGFLSAFSNLNANPDFRAVICGNFNDIMDCLGIAAEPIDGWDGHLEPSKTSTWRTKFYNGVCVNLIGTDSPNNDFPADQPIKYPYLISRKSIAETLSAFDKDSMEYYSMCVGSMKIAMLQRRILTRQEVKKFGADLPVIWDSSGENTKVYAIDASYGGDRCVGGEAEFGQEVGGKVVLAYKPPHIIPIRISDSMSPEDQIATFAMNYCQEHGVPPENVFHDSTGRGSLGTAFARIWSNKCNPVEFGGRPTKRPVSGNMMVYDPILNAHRPKLWDEHVDRFVTELWWAIKLAVESNQVRSLPEEAVSELCMREWNKKEKQPITLETKDEMKKRSRRSPDFGDWSVICLEGARRLGFEIDGVKNKEESESGEDWLERESVKHRRFVRQFDLTARR